MPIASRRPSGLSARLASFLREPEAVDQPRVCREGEAETLAFPREAGAIAGMLAGKQVCGQAGEGGVVATERVCLLHRQCALRPQGVAGLHGVGLGALPLQGRRDHAGKQRHDRHGAGSSEPGLASCPTVDALWRAQRPHADRTSLEIAAEVIGQCACRRVTLSWIAREAFQADRLEVCGHDAQLRGLADFAFAELAQGRFRITGFEWRRAGQQFVEDRTEPPDVGCRRQRRTMHLRLFRRHVARGAGDLFVVDPDCLLKAACQAEVGDQRHAVLVDEEVARLEIQVQHAEPVGVVDGFGDGAQQPCRIVRRQSFIGGEQLRQASSAHQLHRVIRQAGVFAHLVHDHDVGVLQSRGVLCLAPEAVDEFLRRQGSGREQLDRHLAVEATLPGAVDHAHAALADQFQQFVVAELALQRIVEVESGHPGMQQHALHHRRG